MEKRNFVFGTLDLNVLRALSAGPKHGWAIAKWFQGACGETLQIQASTLYSALHRLEQGGWIRARWLQTRTGHRTAKIYFLTPAACVRLEDSRAARCHEERLPSPLHRPATKTWLAGFAACSVALSGDTNTADNAASAIASEAARKVCVCLNLNDLIVPFELARAEYTAFRIFAPAGIYLEWHSSSSAPCHTLQKTKTVVLDFTRGSPSGFYSGALAYSKPFEGLHAVVMYDRIAENARPISIGTLLGHVIAHEITHLLQGVELHSDRGLMKAHWDA